MSGTGGATARRSLRRRWAAMLGGVTAVGLAGTFAVIPHPADAEQVARPAPTAEAPAQPDPFGETLDPNWPAADRPPGSEQLDTNPLPRPPRLPDAARSAAPDVAAFSTTQKQNFNLVKLPWTQRYGSGKVVTDFPHLTSSGICMDRRTDPPRPHPVAAAHCGQVMWNNFRLTKDRVWLGRAKNQARWLVNFRQEYAGGWFYPYLWNSTLHASPTVPTIVLRKPWYSAMAQGEALSLFVRLYESTGDKQYRTAADRTFASLLVPSKAGRPWATWTYRNYLWLEETTFADGTGDRILNGHMFALFGVYDYWVLTADRRARELARAALTTALVYAGRLRQPAWRSYYDDHRRGESNNYHFIHINQLRYLARMTGNMRFNQAAVQLWRDHPRDLTAGTIRLAAGTVKGYRFDRRRPVVHKTITLTSPATVSLSWRNRMPGSSAMWLRITGGTLRGLYVQEQPATAYVSGLAGLFVLDTPLTVTTRAATTPFRPYDTEAQTLGEAVTAEWGKNARVPVDRIATIGGAPHYRVSSGAFEDHWVALSDLNG